MLLLLIACSVPMEDGGDKARPPVEPTPPPTAALAAPAEPQPPSEAIAAQWLVGEWGSNGATLTLQADGGFAFQGQDPCGQDSLSGTWEITRRTPSWVNARMTPTQGEPVVLALGVPLDPKQTPSYVGGDCEKDPIGMESATSWSRL